MTCFSFLNWTWLKNIKLFFLSFFLWQEVIPKPFFYLDLAKKICHQWKNILTDFMSCKKCLIQNICIRYICICIYVCLYYTHTFTEIFFLCIFLLNIQSYLYISFSAFKNKCLHICLHLSTHSLSLSLSLSLSHIHTHTHTHTHTYIYIYIYIFFGNISFSSTGNE